MKQAWRRIGTPDAISWVVIFLVSVQQISGSLTAPFTSISGRVPEFLGLRILSLLAMFVILGLGKLLLLRFARTRPLPWLTLAIFALTPVTGIVLINWLLILTGFTNEWTIGRRLLVAIPGIFTILILSAILVTHARELAHKNLELVETAHELDHSRKTSSARIEARKQELISEVRHQLELSLRPESSGERTTVSANLKSLIDDVVRPMSYELSRMVNTVQPKRIDVVKSKVSWSNVLTATLSRNPAHPLAATLWLGALVGMFLVTGFGLLGLVGTAAFCAISFLILGATRVLWQWMPNTVPSWARAVIFSIALLLLAIVSAPTMQSITGYDFLLVHAFIGWLILCFFMTWTVTLVYGVNESLRSTYRTLIVTVEDLKRETIHLNNELRALQKGVSRVLHGPIQEAISASIHRMTSAGDAQTDAALVGDLQRRIQESLQTLSHPPDLNIDLNKNLNDLIELWDEVVAISVDVSAETLVTIEADALSSAAMLDLVREACSNAIRHGEAKHIAITASLGADHDTAQLVIENDGSPLPSDGRAGLGSLLFDERCLSWSREQRGPTVRVEAHIPLTTSGHASLA